MIGLCAVILCATSVVASGSSSAGADDRLAHHVGSIRNGASVIRFFEHHRWLLRDPRFEQEASRRLAAARRSLAAARADAARLRARVGRTTRTENANREARQRHAGARIARSRRKAICHVFRGYCRQALNVARCESRLRTTARNGQYRGLFQMGSTARQLYGHGETPLAQARAAYRYFVDSGRDWSPWRCKPW